MDKYSLQINKGRTRITHGSQTDRMRPAKHGKRYGMVKAGVIGATGYAGAELIRLLWQHPEAEIVWVGSRSYAGERFSSLYGNMFRLVDDKCLDEDMDRLAEEADVIFTATPQGYCAGIVNDDILKKTKIIDLSADFRLKDVAVYEQWYKLQHKSPQYLPEAVYGLCEINRKDVPGARIVANPGCYTTCSILSLYPLAAERLIKLHSIIIDAKSGTSGAGRGAKTANLYCEVNENIKAYGVASHRHTPEIEEQLGYAAGEPVLLNFTPHLVPMNRGILVTAYADLVEGVGMDDIAAAYEKYYKDEYFIRLLPYGVPAETRFVEGSNYEDISFKVDERTGRVIVMAAIDNLVKGAAGQAVQNMNLLFGLDERTGLTQAPMFP